MRAAVFSMDKLQNKPNRYKIPKEKQIVTHIFLL